MPGKKTESPALRRQPSTPDWLEWIRDFTSGLVNGQYITVGPVFTRPVFPALPHSALAIRSELMSSEFAKFRFSLYFVVTALVFLV